MIITNAHHICRLIYTFFLLLFFSLTFIYNNQIKRQQLKQLASLPDYLKRSISLLFNTFSDKRKQWDLFSKFGPVTFDIYPFKFKFYAPCTTVTAQSRTFKGQFTSKLKFSHHLLTLVSSKPAWLLYTTKEGILKNVLVTLPKKFSIVFHRRKKC